MMHPIREWHDNVLSSGFFYGSLVEAVGVSSLIPGAYIHYPLWQLLLALLFMASGFGVQLVSVYQYCRHHDNEER